MDSIPGSEAFVLIKDLKIKYGVKQNDIANALGISRQAVTDMKAERRRFTKTMAEKLLTKYADEPWADWLRMRLDALFISQPPNFTIPAAPPPQADTDTRTEPTTFPEPPSSQLAKYKGLPVLTSPCRGDPQMSLANTQKYSVIPDELVIQTSELPNSYVLIIDFDSRDGRLRRGDRVLVVQDAGREGEMMVIEYRGTLRMARRGRYERICGRSDAGMAGDLDWVFLDSGTAIPAEAAEAVGCVIGIVMALL